MEYFFVFFFLLCHFHLFPVASNSTSTITLQITVLSNLMQHRLLYLHYQMDETWTFSRFIQFIIVQIDICLVALLKNMNALNARLVA